MATATIRTLGAITYVHGGDDRNVPFQQTTDLVEKLRAQNAALEELIIPDEIHELILWSDWVRAYRVTAEFFDRRLAASEGNKPIGRVRVICRIKIRFVQRKID
jgi:fermentation-respiration switch protein FrsA (DUF1100 family)